LNSRLVLLDELLPRLIYCTLHGAVKIAIGYLINKVCSSKSHSNLEVALGASRGDSGILLAIINPRLAPGAKFGVAESNKPLGKVLNGYLAMVHPEWSDSDLESFEYPDEQDDTHDSDHFDDSGESETLPCPECGASIYEDTPSCPHCGCYVTFSSNLWTGRSFIWLWLGLIGVITLFVALLFGVG